MDERSRFVELVRDLPLVSVDLVLVRDGREVLLGLRTNRPAQGSWFVPGGRVLKNEKRADALARVAARELGIPYAAINVVANFAAGRGNSAAQICFGSIDVVLREAMARVREVLEHICEGPAK